MLIVTYDISSDKLRTQFSKFLEKHGYRLQYSVFKIKQSARILRILKKEISHRFEKKFSNTDSVMIFQFSKSSIDKLIKFGFAKDLDEDIIVM